MKIIPSLLLGSLCLGVASQASASVSLGGDSELFATGVVGAQYNDNIYLSNKNAKSDTILSVAPGLQLLFGQGSMNVGKLSYVEDFQFYSSQSSLNTGLAKADLVDAYDDGKSKLDVDASFHQANQANRNLAGAGFLVRRDLTHAGALSEFGLTEKSRLGLGIAYDDTDYKPAGFADWSYVEIPLKYYYEIGPKLDASAGIRYRENQVGGTGQDSEEFFYSLGARGDLAPKLTGFLDVGYNQRKLKAGGGNQSEIGLESKFVYAYSEKTNVMLGASNQFGYASTGGSYKNLGGYGSFESQVSSDTKVNAGINYTRYTYTSGGRADDFYQAQVGGSYLLNAFTTLNATYAYAKNKSNLAGLGFTSNSLSISAALRY